MNILFLTLLDFSSIMENSIYTDLIREFVKNGHRVYIISPVEKLKRQPTKLIDFGSHKILKLKIGNVQKTNVIEKGISSFMIEAKFVKGISKYFGSVDFDLVLYTTPPITLQKVVAYVKKRDNAKTYLLLKDILPQGAVDLGVLSKAGIKSLLYRYFRNKEKNLYAQSDYIGCMSDANVEYVLRNNPGISSDTVEVCPNSIEPLIAEKEENQIKEIKEKYEIPLNKTVFIYGGNLGKPQGIDFMIECLKASKEDEQVYFVIVGSGTEYKKIKKIIDTEKIANVRLIEQLPKNDYEMLVNSCDVGLIFLDKRFTVPNFPSRLLSYMQASIPVLAATNDITDVGRIIENGNFGVWCNSRDVEEFIHRLKQLCNAEIRKQMGANARKYLEENYTAKHSYEIIMKHFV